jgi:hypothetical protein
VTAALAIGDDNDMDDDAIERVLALYRQCCAQAGVEPLPDDEAREQAQQFLALLAPAFEREFRLH